ncbi:endonuclease domain-containing protein [Peribacillus frigoritolerans]|uniref:endonuclease domain-containing protein n=1 Tax=Peribacillus frigoritolerans TaxID=450367 RepID=UPI003305DD9A
MVEYVVFFGLVITGFVFLGLDMRRSKGVKVDHYIPPYFVELDKCQSPIEKRVLKALWMRDYKPTTQYPIRRYRIDVAFPEYRLAIECDGKEFHSSKKAKAHDRKRDAYLRSIGWKTLRFSGSAINGNMSKVITRIESEIQKKCSSGCHSEE